MKLYDDLRIGAATDTGRVRRSNEDDYLVIAPEDPTITLQRGRLLAIADGMGGVTGGAEASRTAVRSLACEFLAANGGDPSELMARGFARACRSVYEQSRQNPSLRGMGTTLTAINIVRERLVLGHIGDSRCYLLRAGKLRQITEDHAVRDGDNRLTRCVGGGRDSEQADVSVHELRAEDRLLLATDGLWEVVTADDVRRALLAPRPQAAAESLVATANRNGGPDNATALVLHIVRVSGDLGRLHDVELPTEEARQLPRPPRLSPVLLGPAWPWLLLLCVSAVLGAAAIAKWTIGSDVIRWLIR